MIIGCKQLVKCKESKFDVRMWEDDEWVPVNEPGPDPITWFGILVPEQLKRAQKHAVQGIIHILTISRNPRMDPIG